MAPSLTLLRRRFSSSAAAILRPGDPTAVLSAHQKSRAALSLLRSERDPSRVADICRTAALSPSSHLDRAALSAAVSAAPSAVHSIVPDLLLPSHRPHAIALFGQAKLLDHAVRTFKESNPPTVRSLNALLFACILAGEHAELARIFRDYPTSYNITPDLDTYNTVVKSFCESGCSRSFFSVLEEMGHVSIKPNLTTFSTAIAGFYREERLEDVARVLKVMRKHRCHPGLSVYNVRIRGLCKLKRPGDAKELLKEMKGKGMKPNWVTYNHLVFGFCSAGDLEEGKRLYREMKGRGLVPDSSFYFMLAYYLCQGGDFNKALEVCKVSLEKNWVPPFATMKALVNGLVGGSKVEEARGVIEKVKEKFPSKSEMWKEVEEGLAH